MAIPLRNEYFPSSIKLTEFFSRLDVTLLNKIMVAKMSEPDSLLPYCRWKSVQEYLKPCKKLAQNTVKACTYLLFHLLKAMR